MKRVKKSFIKPEVVSPGEEVTEFCRVFDAPLVAKGITWLPITQVLVWAGLSYLAGQRKPERSWTQRLALGGWSMLAALGSEWLHNLAHAAAAKLVGRPVDAIRVVWGMPLLVYFDINDKTLTPQQHIVRAAGGPLLNAVLLPLFLLVRRLAPRDSLASEIGDIGSTMNGFILGAGLLPIPGLDGGAMLRWLLAARGRSLGQADETIRRVNGPTALVLGGLSIWGFCKKKRVIGWMAAVLAAICTLVFTGKLKESR